MTIEQTHKEFNTRLHKEHVGYISPSEVDQFLDLAQMVEFSRLFGGRNPQPVDAQSSPALYGDTARSHSDLAPFKKSFTGTAASGVINIPPDCIHLTTVSINNGSKVVSCEILGEEIFEVRRNSYIVPPTLDKPVAVREGRTLTFLPSGDNDYILRYLKRPARPNFVFTLNGRVLTHDPSTSTDLEWDDASVGRIINKAVSLALERLGEIERVSIPEGRDANEK